MRSYLILKEKAARFHQDPEIAEALAVARVADLGIPTSPQGWGPDALAWVREEAARVDEAALGAQGWGHERLAQLVDELLLGVR
jgi:xylose isomerase